MPHEDFSMQSVINNAEKNARQLAMVYRLPLSDRAWQGFAGSWRGKNAGSSIDFQDHRQYMPGDDPRHIDWKAYGRSGNYIMKLYEEEVSPSIDIFFDFTSSMFINSTKAQLAFEIFYFTWYSAMENSQQVNVKLIGASSFYPMNADAIADRRFPKVFQENSASFPTEGRQTGLRIIISDLLFEEDPAQTLNKISHEKSRLLILTPQSKSEQNPQWQGNLDLIDAESGLSQQYYIDEVTLEDYRLSYQRHFQLWQEEALRRGARFCIFSDDSQLSQQMPTEGLKNRIVETCL